MNNFINSIENINEDIEKLKESYTYNNKVRNKQLLVYYLYRIMCKYYDIFALNSNPEIMNKVIIGLNLPAKFYKCAPLCSNITSDLKKINLLLKNMIELYLNVNESMESNNVKGNPTNINLLKQLIEYKQTKKTIKEDLILLSVLIPSLGKTQNKPTDEI